MLEHIYEDGNECMIFGDFNIAWPSDSFYRNRIESIVNNNGLRQIVTV